MNYILQLNAFWDKVEADGKLRPVSKIVYLALLHVNNTTGWKEHFQVTFGQILSLTGISDVKTYYKAVNELNDTGYIIYIKSLNQYQAATFKIIMLNQKTEGQNQSAEPKNGGTYPIMFNQKTEGHVLSEYRSTPNILKPINDKPINNKDSLVPAKLALPIIDYLNDKANKKFRVTTPKTGQLIAARMAEGYLLADFKKVIDTKCGQWLNDQKFNQYLRPETLFSNKFEGYLNESQVTLIKKPVY